jgi:hypothetical protein
MPKAGDQANIAGVMSIYNGSKWLSLATPIGVAFLAAWKAGAISEPGSPPPLVSTPSQASTSPSSSSGDATQTLVSNIAATVANNAVSPGTSTQSGMTFLNKANGQLNDDDIGNLINFIIQQLGNVLKTRNSKGKVKTYRLVTDKPRSPKKRGKAGPTVESLQMQIAALQGELRGRRR